MKFIKLLMLALIISASSNLLAQDSKTVEMEAKAMTQEITEKVSLNEDEQVRVYRQLITYKNQEARFAKQDDNGKNTTANLEKHREVMMKNVEEIVGEKRFTKIEGILAEDKPTAVPASSTLRSN